MNLFTAVELSSVTCEYGATIQRVVKDVARRQYKQR